MTHFKIIILCLYLKSLNKNLYKETENHARQGRLKMAPNNNDLKYLGTIDTKNPLHLPLMKLQNTR